MKKYKHPPMEPIKDPLTYDQLKTIHSAERFIRQLCGVGLTQADLQHYPEKKERNKQHVTKADELCAELNSIWVPRC